jgi:PAS domain S-box-containing protein
MATLIWESGQDWDAASLEIEDWWRLFVENAVDCALVILDRSGRIAGWNRGAEQIKGYRADEIVGAHFSRFYLRHDADGGKPRLALERAAAEGRFEDEGWRVRKDGTIFRAHVVISALRDGAGRLRGYGKLTHDLTQRDGMRHEAESARREHARRTEKLEKSGEELELFSMAVAHDLRAPLAVIDNLAHVAEEKCGRGAPSDSARLLQAIRRIAGATQVTIDDLLQYGRVGGAPLRLADVDMEGLVGEAWAGIGTNVPVDFRMGRLPRAVGDRGLLKHVWTNLLSNAVKYSGKRAAPVIEVTGRAGDTHATYSVKDNGVGFDMSFYARLFKIFQRLHAEDDFPGTGVGLAIAGRIVARHGGHIFASSQVDEGAAFSFVLPLAGPSNADAQGHGIHARIPQCP